MHFDTNGRQHTPPLFCLCLEAYTTVDMDLNCYMFQFYFRAVKTDVDTDAKSHFKSEKSE